MQKLAVGLLAALLSPLAVAHDGHSHNLIQAAIHPFFGWDHLFAMVMVGMTAHQVMLHRHPNPKASLSTSPLAFPVAFMLLTACGLLMAQHGQLSVVPYEAMIVLSVFALGLTLIKPVTLRYNKVMLLLIGVFGFSHGYAHGAELGGSSTELISGMLLGTGLLHTIGFLFSRQVANHQWANRGIGISAVIASGLAVLGAY